MKFTSNALTTLLAMTVGTVLISLATTRPVQAVVLHFDDIIISSDYTTIADSYGGFNWTNFGVIQSSAIPYSGYNNGTVSGANTAFNLWGTSATTTMANVFDFNGAYLTAAWYNDLNIRVEGFLGGVIQYSQTVVVNPDHPTWFDFNFQEIDRLDFTSFGGYYGGYSGDGTHFVMDDFTFNEPVPEPTSLISFLGLGAIGVRSWLKAKQHRKA